MIAQVEIKSRSPVRRRRSVWRWGPYERIEGVAHGAWIRRIRAIEASRCWIRRRATRMEWWHTDRDFVLLRPADAARGNGRLLYEVNNRGRIMLFANLCAGAAGNQPKTAADLGNALPLRLGYSLLWTGWDPGAPKATGLWLDVPVIEGTDEADPRGIRFRHPPRRA